MHKDYVKRELKYDEGVKNFLFSLRGTWKISLTIIIIFGLFGYILANIQPTIYQSSILISPAKVNNNPVDSNENLQELIKSDQFFFSREVYDSCGTANSPDPHMNLVKNLYVEQSNYSNALKLSYTSTNSEILATCLKGIFNQIKLKQEIIFKYKIEAKILELSYNKSRLAALQKFMPALINARMVENSTKELDLMSFLISTQLDGETKLLELKIKTQQLELDSAATANTLILVGPLEPTIKIFKLRTIIFSIASALSGLIVVLIFLTAKYLFKIR